MKHFVLGVLLCAVPIVVEAQEPKRRNWDVNSIGGQLDGITTIEIRVAAGGLDNPCSLGSEAVRLATAKPILDGGLVVTDFDLEAPRLDVRAVTRELGETDYCVAALEIHLWANSMSALLHQQPKGTKIVDLLLPTEAPRLVAVTYAPALLHDRLVVAGATRERFHGSATAAIVEMVTSLVTQIRLANQKK